MPAVQLLQQMSANTAKASYTFHKHNGVFSCFYTCTVVCTKYLHEDKNPIIHLDVHVVIFASEGFITCTETAAEGIFP